MAVLHQVLCLAMDMSLRDTVWTDHGQGMHNAVRCTRPAHSLTTLAHSSRRPARSHGIATIECKYLENQPRPATAANHCLEVSYWLSI